MAYKDLSNTAKALLSGFFGMGDAILTMGNEQSALSKEANLAMSELLYEGYVSAKKSDDSRAASLTYQLTDKGSKIKRAVSQSFMEKHGRFKLTQPLEH